MASEYLIPGCFGKLPIDREYLEADVSSPVTRLLRRLLREMREEGESFPDAPAAVATASGPRSREVLFLLNARGGADLLAGVLRPSRDQGGRDFPFALFVPVPRKIYGRHYALLPMALAGTWEALGDAWRSLSGLETREAFEEMFDNIEVPAPPALAEIKASYQAQTRESMAELFSRPGGLARDCVDSRLPALIDQVKKSGHGEGVMVRLPAPSDLRQAAFEASFWIDLLNRQFMMRRVESSVFLHHDPAARTHWLLLGIGETSDAVTKALLGGGTSAVTVDLSAAGRGGETEASDEYTITYGDVLKQRLRGRA